MPATSPSRFTFQRHPLGGIGLFAAVTCLALFSPSAPGEDSVPENLGSVNVLQAVLNVHVTTEYAQFGNSPAYVTRMTIESVKTPSAAQRAGLKPGMQIVAIQGQRVAGLTRGMAENLMDQPVKDALVLLVKKSWYKKAEEVTLPLPKVKPEEAASFPTAIP